MKCSAETITHLAPKIWFIVTEAIKNSKSLESFKLKVRKWKPKCLYGLYHGTIILSYYSSMVI